jgi:hypothetical protein
MKTIKPDMTGFRVSISRGGASLVSMEITRGGETISYLISTSWPRQADPAALWEDEGEDEIDRMFGGSDIDLEPAESRFAPLLKKAKSPR